MHGKDLMRANTSKFKSRINNICPQEWNRENVKIPSGIRRNETNTDDHPTVVEVNFSHISTISNFIKERSSKHNIERQFINKPEHGIPTILSRSWVAL